MHRRVVAVGLALGALAACAVLPTQLSEDSVNLGSIYSALTSEAVEQITTGVAYGTHARQRLDIYRAAPDAEMSPIAIYYYGGNWSTGDRSTYRFIGAALAARGITTVVPDYRLYPEVKFPAFVDDSALAYAWVAKNLASRCAARRPIVVIGHSAGGHMAALLSLDRSYLAKTAPDASQPSALIGLAGPYAFDPTTWPSTKDIFSTAAGKADIARPVAFARAGAPPALLVHGSDDDTVRLFNTRELAAALQAKGNVVRTAEYDGIGHVGLVLAMSRPLRWRAPVLADILAFIDANAGGTSRAPLCEKAAAE